MIVWLLSVTKQNSSEKGLWKMKKGPQWNLWKAKAQDGFFLFLSPILLMTAEKGEK